MRSWARSSGLRLGLFWVSALLWAGSSHAAVGDDTERLEAHVDPRGGVRATAHVVFPAPSHVIQAILTDYAEWPALFETKMRVASLSIDQGVATIDLRISHGLLPGERRLVSESKALANGGLVTDLKEGDFKRYHRVWMLTATDNGSRTRADFEMIVEIETLLPDWLVAIAIRQELAAHFRIVKEKALRRATPGT
ncbi:MAG TPA: hypothetical protein VD738_07095 [Nitrospira sp.]|nr:hypothetical protein [Nitrospira sp.]